MNIDFLSPGDLFLVKNRELFFTRVEPDEEVLCCFNSISKYLNESKPYVIMVPRGIGVECYVPHEVWIDKFIALQWNHIYFNRDGLEKIFLRKF